MTTPHTSRCPTCGRPVLVAQLKRDDGRTEALPVDPEPVKDGNVMLYWSAKAGTLRAEVWPLHLAEAQGILDPNVKRRVSHHATCKGAP